MKADGALGISKIKSGGGSSVEEMRGNRKDNMVKRNIGSWRMPMELEGDEGRDKLRKAAERSTYPLTRG